MAPKRKAGDGNGNGASSTKGAGKAAKKAAPKKNAKGKGPATDSSSSESEDDDRPEQGIERQPRGGIGKGLRSFIIKRLVRYTDKSGALVAEADCPIDMNADYFEVAYGDFLLERGETREVREVRVKNYFGEERYVPRRMLQDIYLPWGMGTTIDRADDGVGLPLSRVCEDVEGEGDGDTGFDKDEVVMDLDAVDADPVTVIDFERTTGLIPITVPVAGANGTMVNVFALEQICPYPYDIRVPQTWLDDYVARTIEKYGDGNDRGNGRRGGRTKGPADPDQSSGDSDSSSEQGPSDSEGREPVTNAPGRVKASKAAADPYNGWTPINRSTKSGAKNVKTSNARKSSPRNNIYVEGEKYECGLPSKKGPPCTKTYIYTSDPIGCWIHNGK